MHSFTTHTRIRRIETLGRKIGLISTLIAAVLIVIGIVLIPAYDECGRPTSIPAVLSLGIGLWRSS